jgi:DNA-directed RNA polymerase specialized sigma subunit
MPTTIKEAMRTARTEKEREIVEILKTRTDLTYSNIGAMFGATEEPIKRIAKKYNFSRPSGPKPKKQVPRVL